MIKIPYDAIIDKIKEQSQLSEEEINAKIKAKSDQLAGLISKEGAAHIIANELGVKLFEEGQKKIKDIMPGMNSVEVAGKITNIYELREFQRKDGTPGKVASFVIGDESGKARVVLWNDQTDLIKDLQTEKIVLIKNGFAKENNNGVEIHLASKSEIEVDPEGIIIGEVGQKPSAKRKKIKDLAESDSNVEILATAVQIFEPRFYEICPQCSKRIRLKEGSFACDAHGKVEPDFGYVLNAVLDDGSETIRTVFFRNQLLNLLNKKHEEIIQFKDSPGDFQLIKNDILGKIVKVVGRTTKNEMFDRLEFVAQLVFSDPNPDEELKKLKEEAKVID